MPAGLWACRLPRPYHGASHDQDRAMSHPFKVGDHVRWNSEAGYVTGHITGVHETDTPYKGHMRRCTPADPQYEIRSDKTTHVAMHKGSVLTRLDD